MDPTEAENAQRVGTLLRLLLDSSGLELLLAFTGDGDYHFTVLRQGGPRYAVSRPDLAEALEAALYPGKKNTKVCQGPCGLRKPLYQFSRYAANPDGRNRYCRQCEVERVKKWQAQRKPPSED